MKLELIVFAITIFFIINTYYDGKYIQMLKSWKKYYKMIGIGFIGLSFYLYTKKNPGETSNILSCASNMVKHMPIDRASGDYLTPILKMAQNQTMQNQTMQNQTMQNQTMQNQTNNSMYNQMSSQERKILSSGKKTTKRCVSETKKKYVASQQGWNCGACNKQLPAWFEVDHKIRLDNGGTNHIDNLVALCIDCHGKKTAFENL